MCCTAGGHARNTTPHELPSPPPKFPASFPSHACLMPKKTPFLSILLQMQAVRPAVCPTAANTQSLCRTRAELRQTPSACEGPCARSHLAVCAALTAAAAAAVVPLLVSVWFQCFKYGHGFLQRHLFALQYVVAYLQLHGVLVLCNRRKHMWQSVAQQLLVVDSPTCDWKA
jgi:hypothetical protein